jgi:hypothetical protein
LVGLFFTTSHNSVFFFHISVEVLETQSHLAKKTQNRSNAQNGHGKIKQTRAPAFSAWAKRSG